MKILTRDFQWVDATFNWQVGRIVKSDGNAINESHIIAIYDDTRNKYVICNNCGKVIRNTPKAIQAHKALAETSDKCFDCPHMRERNNVVLKNSYTPQADGTYISSVKQQCNLVCVRGFRDRDINGEAAKDNCIYKRCATSSTTSIEDTFTRYPGAFEDMATVDAIDTNKWSLIGNSDTFYAFKAASRFNLTAYVHNTGIVSHFRYISRYTSYEFRYSKKYNQLFWFDNSTYSTSCGISQNIQTQLLKLVAAIYNKEN